MTIPFNDDDVDLYVYNQSTCYDKVELNENKQDDFSNDVKYSVQVQDDNEDLQVYDNANESFECVHYDSPISNYHHNLRQDQFKLRLDDNQLAIETSRVMSVVADRFSEKYFSKKNEQVVESTSESNVGLFKSVLDKFNSILKVYKWFTRFN